MPADPHRRQRIFIGFGAGTIGSFDLGPDGDLQPVHRFEAGDMPSFLAFDEGSRLRCINEESGGLSSFDLGAGDSKPRPLGRVACPGGPAYLAIDRTRALAFTANYGGGTASVFRVGDRDEPQHLQTLEIGVYPHSAILDPTARHLYVPSKGSDRIVQFAITDDPQSPLRALDPDHRSTATRAGPRHLRFHPQLPVAYCANELDSTVDVWDHDRETGQLSRRATLSSLPEGVQLPDNTGSDIHLHPSGRWVYASNRGHDSIARFSVDPQTGDLKLEETSPTGGRVPRNFGLSPRGDRLLVANQESKHLRVFSIAEADGALTRIADHEFDDRPFWVGVDAPA